MMRSETVASESLSACTIFAMREPLAYVLHDGCNDDALRSQKHVCMLTEAIFYDFTFESVERAVSILLEMCSG